MGRPVAVTTPCYCNRDDVARALDFKPSQLVISRIDRAMQSAARNIEGHLKRKFYPQDRTLFFDWPNYQYADPWRLWLNQQDILAMTSLQSPLGTPIPLNQVFLEPVNKEAWEPYTSIQLDRSSNAAWGTAPTPQHSIVAAGTWGYTAEQDPAGTLAAAVATTTATTITVSDASLCGVGDLLILDPGRGAAPFPSALGYAGAIQPYTGERVLITDRAAVDTGQAQIGSGCSTALDSDQALLVADGTKIHPGEVLLLDQERMFVEEVNGNAVTVERAWDGTTLETHTGADILAYRLLTVIRGYLGTAAATHAQGAAVARHRVPSLVRDLAIAESEDRILQEPSGYARMAGSGDAARPAPGAGLADLWDEAMTVHGRKDRIRAI